MLKRASGRTTQRVLLAGALAAIGWTHAAAADPTYPNRPITLIAPYSAGGDADLAARNFSAAATKVLGQSIVVMNRTGASGIVGSTMVVTAPPDGYTLLLARTGSQSIMPAIEPAVSKYKWDDYTFIGTLETNPYGCVVNAKSPYKTFQELATALRTNGRKMNYGTAGTMTTNDLGPRQLFKLLKLTDETPTQIPYKGTGEAAASLLAGFTEFSCGSLGSFLPLAKSGQLRILMTTSAERVPFLPDVPTAKELGLPEMGGVVGWSAIFGPPNLPTDIRDKLAGVLKTIASDPAWQAGTASTGSVPSIRSPQETKQFAREQFELYRSLGESLGIIDSKM